MSRWLKEYNLTLNRRSKWSILQERFLKTGHLVWIVEPTSPKEYNVLVRIVKLHFGKNAVARSAELKTSFIIPVRPLVKLAPVLQLDSNVSYILFLVNLSMQRILQCHVYSPLTERAFFWARRIIRMQMSPGQDDLAVACAPLSRQDTGAKPGEGKVFHVFCFQKIYYCIDHQNYLLLPFHLLLLPFHLSISINNHTLIL